MYGFWFGTRMEEFDLYVALHQAFETHIRCLPFNKRCNNRQAIKLAEYFPVSPLAKSSLLAFLHSYISFKSEPNNQATFVLRSWCSAPSIIGVLVAIFPPVHLIFV